MIPENLSITERLLLANQCKILAKLYPDNAGEYNLKTEIVEAGHIDLYDELFSRIGEGTSREVSEETHDILNMYGAINNVVESLSEDEKNRLNLRAIRFEGFDGNHDKHYFFMKFMIEKTDLYEEYRNTPLNSHSQASLMKYRRMLAAYKPIIEANNYTLEAGNLSDIINAAIPGAVLNQNN